MKTTVFQIFTFFILIFFNNGFSQNPDVRVQYLRGQAWLMISELPSVKSDWTVFNHLGKPIRQLVLHAGPTPAYFDISTWNYGLYGYRWTTGSRFGTGQFGLMPFHQTPEYDSVKD